MLETKTYKFSEAGAEGGAVEIADEYVFYILPAKKQQMHNY